MTPPWGWRRGSVADAALSGLLQPRKTLPAKLFYDEEGCRLFGRITELPEYYLTRTERALLADVAPRVAALVRGPAVLVEYGASDEAKAEFLLREGRRVPRLCADRRCGSRSSSRCGCGCTSKRPDLQVCVVPADFMDVVALPTQVPSLPRLGFFPGSTIGNLDPRGGACVSCSGRAARWGTSSWFLVGVDLRKDPAILLPAYDDAQGVTAAFNLNLLVRLNREAGADFDLSAFAHRAVWNDAGKPDRDAPGQPARSDGSVSLVRRSISPRRDDPHREQL